MKSFCTRLAARLGLLGLSLLMLPSVQAAVDPDSLAPGLAPLAPWVGLTFRGELADSTPEQPKVDVQHWERILNGQAIRIMHSINDGEYGGETLVIWDSERQTIAYWYVTTAGFHTEGTINPKADGNWRFKPMPGTSVLFDTGPRAADYLSEVTTLAIEPAGDGPDGFARFRITL